MAASKSVEELEQAIRAYALLQGRLVRAMLAQYAPNDLETFWDLPKASIVVDQRTWKFHRHGAGVTFEDDDGVLVNAHVELANHPEGVDAWRLYEWLDSRGVASIDFRGVELAVDDSAFKHAILQLAAAGVLRRVVTPGPFSHVLFEVSQPVVLSFSPDEALVLFALVARLNAEAATAFEDQAEQRALWNLEARLESALTEPFEPDYPARLAAARARLRDLP